MRSDSFYSSMDYMHVLHPKIAPHLAGYKVASKNKSDAKLIVIFGGYSSNCKMHPRITISINYIFTVNDIALLNTNFNTNWSMTTFG